MVDATKEVILYDLLSRPPNHCWSPSTWKTRLILNYKNIPYRTIWIDYTDVEATLKPLASLVSPETSGQTKYTVPVAMFPDGKTVMDSAAIACELEQQFPDAAPVAGIPSASDLKVTAGSDPGPALAELAEFEIPHHRLAKVAGRAMAVGVIEHVVSDKARPKKIAEMGGEEAFQHVKSSIEIPKILADLQNPLLEMNEFWVKLGGPFTPEGKLRWTAVRQLTSLHYLKKGAPELFDFIMTNESSDVIAAMYKEATARGWFARDDE